MIFLAGLLLSFIFAGLSFSFAAFIAFAENILTLRRLNQRTVLLGPHGSLVGWFRYTDSAGIWADRLACQRRLFATDSKTSDPGSAK